MTSYNIYPEDHEQFEYHGNTTIEWTHQHNGNVKREWIHFDSVDEAVHFFYEVCAQ